MNVVFTEPVNLNLPTFSHFPVLAAVTRDDDLIGSRTRPHDLLVGGRRHRDRPYGQGDCEEKDYSRPQHCLGEHGNECFYTESLFCRLRERGDD